MERGSKMSTASTSVLSVELLLRVIDVEYGYFTLLYFGHIWELLVGGICTCFT